MGAFGVWLNLVFEISTRPFLNVIEKKWIVFQLLKALEECHSKKVGDRGGGGGSWWNER